MEGPPLTQEDGIENNTENADDIQQVASESEPTLSQHLREALERSEIEQAVVNLCSTMNEREERGYLQLASSESIYDIQKWANQTPKGKGGEALSFAGLAEIFSLLNMALERFLEKPEGGYSNDDLESLGEVVFRLRDLKERVFSLSESVSSADESQGKEDSDVMRGALETAYELLERKEFQVGRLISIYEEYINRR